MTILTTTKRRTIDTSIARDVDFGADDIRPGIEEYSLVTLARTEEVTGHGVLSNPLQGTRHTKGATRHIDNALAT